MLFRTKWIMISFGGSVLIAVGFLVFPDALFWPAAASLNVLMSLVFWPVALCEHLVGPGPSIGLLSRHLHEGTPVHILAAVIGVAFAWMFWSSMIFLLIWAKIRWDE